MPITITNNSASPFVFDVMGWEDIPASSSLELVLSEENLWVIRHSTSLKMAQKVGDISIIIDNTENFDFSKLTLSTDGAMESLSVPNFSSGSTFPASPQQGWLHFYTTDNLLYYYDPIRVKWLSANRVLYSFNYDGEILNGDYLALNGVLNTYANHGLEHNITIVGYSVSQTNDGNDTADIIISNHETDILTINFPATTKAHSTLDTDINVLATPTANMGLRARVDNQGATELSDVVLHIHARWSI
jgi:hypothetical protein